MKIACEIIKDLLPLYQDGVCSKESKAIVEEHMAECDNCKAELDAMNEMVLTTSKEHNLSEAEEVNSLSRKWKKGMWKSSLKGALFTVLVIAAILVTFYCFVDISIM